MMKFSFLSILIMALMSCNNASKTTVRVHLDKPQGEIKPQLITKDSTYVMALDSTNTALFVMAENLKPGYATVVLGRMQVPVYVEPGKSFDVSVKFEGRRMIPAFTGEGAKKNEYLNSPALRFSPDYKLEEAEFLASLDEQIKKLNENLDTLGFDPQFNQLEKKRLAYMVYGPLPIYPLYHPYYAQAPDFKPTDAFYNKLVSAITEDEALIGMNWYQEALIGRVQAMAAKDLEDRDNLTFTKKQLDYVEQNFKNPAVVEYLVDQIVTAYVKDSGVDHLAEVAPVYSAKVTDPAKKAKFDELCAKWARIAVGQPSPSFKYLDINGKEVSLADLAGKYVYIDTWATWCGPCRGELPHLKTLEEKYGKKNIYFVSISCDRDKAAWEKMVKEDKLGGIQLHNGGDNTFMDAYMITGIPRFILLDKEGKIINAKMTRPSNPETAKTFDALEGI